MVRHGNKYYWRLPWGLGEIQYGQISRGLRVWLRGKLYTIKRPNYRRMHKYMDDR